MDLKEDGERGGSAPIPSDQITRLRCEKAVCVQSYRLQMILYLFEDAVSFKTLQIGPRAGGNRTYAGAAKKGERTNRWYKVCKCKRLNKAKK